MSVVIEVHKIKAVKVGGEWLDIAKKGSIADEDCVFEDEDGDNVGEFAGGVLSFEGADGEDYVVSLADVQAFRMK